MNAIADNAYTQKLRKLGEEVLKLKPNRPLSALIISAHWVTDGTKILSSKNPRTIHDFYGFPDELFQVQYPAPGAVAVADRLLKEDLNIEADSTWGFDHGAWSVLKHLFPDHQVPVTQLSLNRNLSSSDFFALGQKLRFLRSEGVLIIGSGNLVHNLRQIDWDMSATPFDWAQEFDEVVASNLRDKTWSRLVDLSAFTEAQWKRAHPSAEHWLPLLPVLGAATPEEPLEFLFDEIQNGSIAMRSLQIGSMQPKF